MKQTYNITPGHSDISVVRKKNIKNGITAENICL